MAADGQAALLARLQQARRLGQADVAAQAALLLHDMDAFEDLRTASAAVNNAATMFAEEPTTQQALTALY